MTLIGNELVKVTGITPTGGPSGQEEQCTTADIANLTPGSSGANPSATAGPSAVNGSATTFMRSDAAPAVQKASASQFGIVEVDNTTITSAAGVISAIQQTLPTGANPTGTAGPTAVNGSASTFLRSDGAPAVQLGTAAQKGILQVDGTSITVSAGVISAAAGSGSSGANPSATAGPTAVNGSAVTFLRSDGAPAIQLGTNAQKGIVQVDGTTLTASSGVISVATGSGAVPPSAITLPNGKVIKGNGSAQGAAADDFAIIELFIDGSGSAITTGIKKPYQLVDFDFTITQATLLLDQSGSLQVDILACTYAQFDAGSTHPVAGDKITASAPLTVSSATKTQDTTLTGWTTIFTGGTVLVPNVIGSPATTTQGTVILKVKKT